MLNESAKPVRDTKKMLRIKSALLIDVLKVNLDAFLKITRIFSLETYGDRNDESFLSNVHNLER